MNNTFVHLRVHTEFSLADGIVRVDELTGAAAAGHMPAVAVTDLANLFALVKFYRAAIAAGVKPIIGADLWLENASDAHKPFRLIVLCQNLTGYRHLSRLLTRAYVEGQQTGRPCIRRSWLEGATEGLIALSGAHDGDIGNALLARNLTLAQQLAEDYQRLFPQRFYLELQRTGHAQQEDYVHAAVTLAQRCALPVVATNNVHFMQRDDFEAHEIRVCIHDGRVLTDARRPRRFTPQQYFRSTEEMIELFRDVPEAITNTVEIARRCNLRLELGRNYLPDYPVPPGKQVDAVLREQADAGLAQHLARLDADTRKTREPEYRQRLELELGVIIKMGFAGYFLIVADFISWAKRNDVPVGPGRGSGAGSLVAYALGITELDPIRYELLFERFLNPERVSLPDFDVDFCMVGRDRVIDYVTERYGQNKVSQIITHGTMAAKAAVRDVGRVMDHPYGYVDKIAKLIPLELGITLDKALEQEPLLKERYDNEEDVRALLDAARKLEGIARNAGKHAGGVVIAPSDLTDFMPLYCEQGGTQLVTQLDKDDVEALGLVKFDFLGLRTLTIIDKAVKIINAERARKGEAALDMQQLPIDDPAAYALLKSCRTTALFQLESRGMKDLIQRLQPDNFEEIVALVALFRPGPLESGMVDDFIKRKRDKQQRIDYFHPSLEPILKPTYGVIVYQEQVMQIAQVLSGYTLGSADLLRRAMGKKKPEEMAKQRDSFVKGAVARWPEIGAAKAGHLFDLIEKFAGYGFNRSHSAAYALIAYHTAWLKAHYPAAFMAAVLSADMDHTDKVVTMIAECRDMQLKIEPPDINRCSYEFLPIEGNIILYGLGAIKGLGAAAIEIILQARASGGAFKDLFDLCHRIDLHKVNRRVLESLIRGGALDRLGTHRAALMVSLDRAMQAAGQHSKNQDAGQNDLFGSEPSAAPAPHYAEVAPWSEEQRLEAEKETLGLYLTGHPIARFERELARIIDARLSELKPTQDRGLRVAGLVVGMRIMNTRRGDRMAFITLDDRTGRLELAVFSELFNRYRELLAKDSLLVVEGHVSVDEYTGGFKMNAERIYNMEQARAALAERLVIRVGPAQAANGFMHELKDALTPVKQGSCPVVIHYQRDDAEVEIALGQEWRVHPTNKLLERLGAIAGDDSVRCDYLPAPVRPVQEKVRKR